MSLGNLLVLKHNSQLNDIVQLNVKKYGAKGDGVTLDHVSIQSAVNDASVNGGIVNFPKGTFVIGSDIFIPSNVTLRGAGKEDTIIKVADGSTQKTAIRGGYYAANYNVDDNNSAHISTNINIENLTIDGNYSMRGDSAVVANDKFNLIQIVWTNGINIRNCIFKNAINNGIQIDCSANVLIENCIVQNIHSVNPVNGYYCCNGMSVGGGLSNFLGLSNKVLDDNIVIRNCRVYDIDDIGISITGKDTQEGITKYYDAYNITICDCYIEKTNGGIGIEGGQGAWLNSGIHDVTIHHNKIVNTGNQKPNNTTDHAPAIWLDDRTYDCVVTCNEIETGKSGGILVRGFDSTVDSNVINNIKLFGIWYGKNYYVTEWCTNMICKDNIICGNESTSNFGIWVSDTDNLLIQNNKIYNIKYDTADINNKYAGKGSGIQAIDRNNKLYIKGNLFSSMLNVGIRILLTSTASIKEMYIENNTILDCDDVGILVYTANNTFVLNSIIANNAIIDDRAVPKMPHAISWDGLTTYTPKTFNNFVRGAVSKTYPIDSYYPVVQSPNSTYYRIVVSDAGVLSATGL